MGVRGFKMFCQRGSEFFLLALCVCGGGQVQYLSFREKNNRPHPLQLINDWSQKQKVPRVTTSLISFLRYFLFFHYRDRYLAISWEKYATIAVRTKNP